RSGSLDQVWMNLLVNAADAFEDEREDLARTEEGHEGDGRALPARGAVAPRIVVKVAHEGAVVVVEVSDNGPGIPEDLQARIFEPHFTTRAGRVRYGLGMGLSIVSTILTDAGGGIEVESGPGATRVRVTLVAVDVGEGES
ncbi:MAG: sensor histidine kinase, partial [Pauljensenia sp.]